MRTRELKKIGIPKGEPTKRAFELIKNLASQKHNQKQIKTILSGIAANPTIYRNHQTYSKLAKVLEKGTYTSPKTPATYQKWGKNLDSQSVKQMENAFQFPERVVGALMPQAH